MPRENSKKGVRSKDAIRRSVWTAMEKEGVARFPGAQERIPNFANARGAAERLARHPAWKKAKTIKANPDAPQTHSRRLALEEGKILVMAVPRLRDDHPFRLLDPSRLTKAKIREAATIKGALRHGEVIDVDQVPKLDLILCGSVAVNLKGARIGKGGGFSDLEYAMLAEAGTVSEKTTIVDHRASAPDHAGEPARHDPRHPGRPDRHAAGRDRRGARIPAPEGHPVGPPPAAADPRDPRAGAHGLCVIGRDPGALPRVSWFS